MLLTILFVTSLFLLFILMFISRMPHYALSIAFHAPTTKNNPKLDHLLFSKGDDDNAASTGPMGGNLPIIRSFNEFGRLFSQLDFRNASIPNGFGFIAFGYTFAIFTEGSVPKLIGSYYLAVGCSYVAATIGSIFDRSRGHKKKA